ASFYGCGLAIALPGAKILEPAILPGAEFSLALHPGADWDRPVQSPEAQAMRAELLRRGAVNGAGQAQVAAFSPVLGECCQKQNLDLEFSCAVIAQRGDRLQVVGVDGLREIQAGRVINALPDDTAPEKMLTGILSLPLQLPDGSYGPFQLRNSCRAGEAYLGLSIPAAASWPEARQLFHAAWDRRPESLQEAHLLLLGTYFSWPGDANPVLAFDRGICEGRAK
ncbi:MAG: hypothetical protein GX564_06555, partial [Oligosphaeraceae bacterium]|nr:hypothetical protein [Oligosphaeraceae bacterium]